MTAKQAQYCSAPSGMRDDGGNTSELFENFLSHVLDKPLTVTHSEFLFVLNRLDIILFDSIFVKVERFIMKRKAESIETETPICGHMSMEGEGMVACLLHANESKKYWRPIIVEHWGLSILPMMKFTSKNAELSFCSSYRLSDSAVYQCNLQPILWRSILFDYFDQLKPFAFEVEIEESTNSYLRNAEDMSNTLLWTYFEKFELNRNLPAQRCICTQAIVGDSVSIANGMLTSSALKSIFSFLEKTSLSISSSSPSNLGSKYDKDALIVFEQVDSLVPFTYCFPASDRDSVGDVAILNNFKSDLINGLPVFSNGISEYGLSRIWYEILQKSEGNINESVVIDVGGHFGYYSVLASAFGANVISFEPVPIFRDGE